MKRSKAKELSKFLELMLEFRPNRRATASELLDHEWLEDADTTLPFNLSP